MAFPTASPSGCDMSVTATLVRRPQPRARAAHIEASSSAASGVFMKAPLPAFTSSSTRSDSTASFLLMTLAAISGMLGTVAVASRRA